jgi:hypothetical protein
MNITNITNTDTGGLDESIMHIITYLDSFIKQEFGIEPEEYRVQVIDTVIDLLMDVRDPSDDYGARTAWDILCATSHNELHLKTKDGARDQFIKQVQEYRATLNNQLMLSL